jgi:hypothetical protein
MRSVEPLFLLKVFGQIKAASSKERDREMLETN